MASGVNPYAIAGLQQAFQQTHNLLQNISKDIEQKTRAFKGQTAEDIQELTQQKSLAIEKALGELAPGPKKGETAMDLFSKFMPPELQGILSFFSTRRKGRRQRMHALAQINKAMEYAKMPSKYKNTWMGKQVSKWTSDYEREFERIKQGIPSRKDITKSAIMSGVGSYIMANKVPKGEKWTPLAGGLDLKDLKTTFRKLNEVGWKNLSQAEQKDIMQILSVFKMN